MDNYFHITRLYSNADGDSLFEDQQLPLSSGGTIGLLSDAIAAKSVIFREVEPGYDYDIHNAPQKQYIVLLDGGIEIETSLGEKRQFETGEVLLVEDVSGKGHRTRNLKPQTRRSIFITLP